MLLCATGTSLNKSPESLGLSNSSTSSKMLQQRASRNLQHPSSKCSTILDIFALAAGTTACKEKFNERELIKRQKWARNYSEGVLFTVGLRVSTYPRSKAALKAVRFGKLSHSNSADLEHDGSWLHSLDCDSSALCHFPFSDRAGRWKVMLHNVLKQP